MHGLFFSNEISTIDKILTTVNDDPELPTIKIITIHKLSKNTRGNFNTRFKECVHNIKHKTYSG
jgi:hypothetical protein